MSMNTEWKPALLAALFLAACGGGGEPPPLGQVGAGEQQVKQATGASTTSVSGLALLVSPAGSQPASLQGGNAGVGVNEIIFQIEQFSTLSIDLNSASLAALSTVAVLDAKGVVRLSADTGNAQARVQLEAGTYQLRYTGATAASQEVTAALWLDGDSALASVPELQLLTSGSCPNCNLQSANLSALSLSGFNLSGADLRKAVLVHAPGGLKLLGTDTMTVLLSVADPVSADLTGANLIGVKLSGAYLTGVGQRGAQLGGVSLSAALATDLFLPRADLTGANLSGTDLSRSVLSHASLRGANMTNTIMMDSDLSNADLSGATLGEADFTRANLSGAIWTDRRVCAAGSLGRCL